MERDACMAIYGDIFIADEESRTFTVFVSPCRPVRVTRGGGDSTDLLLPPVQVVFTLPPDYPAVVPSVSLSSPWLGGLNAPVMERMAKEVASAMHPGEEAVLPVVMALEEASDVLKLGIDLERDLLLVDPRSASQLWSLLVSFDAAERERVFLRDSHLCEICCVEKTGSLFPRQEHRCKEQGHQLFCGSCLVTHARERIGEGVFDLMCPGGCKKPIPVAFLKESLEEEEFARFDDLMTLRSLEGLGLVQCPRCEFSFLRGEDDIKATGAQANLGLCPNCGNSFCTLCNGTFHALSPCKSVGRAQNKQLLFFQRQSGMSFEEMFSAFEDAKSGLSKEARALIAEIKTGQLIRSSSDFTRCPGCPAVISKNGGCNKVVCSKCNTIVCWLCKNEIQGYNHFGGGSCVLFTAEDLLVAREDDPNGIMNALAHGGAVIKNCPRCHKGTVKVNDSNHMRCQCGHGWCFICLKKVVQVGVDHFQGRWACPLFTNEGQDQEMM